MRLRDVYRFQKALTLAVRTANPNEARAAELAARRLMAAYNIDPMIIPDRSILDGTNFADTALLKTLREEWRATHPDFYYSKPDSQGSVRRLRHKPRPRKPKPENVHEFDGMFDGLFDN